VLITFTSFSQTVINNPHVGYSTVNYLKITKVVLSDSATTLYCHIDYSPGNWISIPSKTYIQPVGSDEKFYVTGTEGVTFGKRYTIPESGEADYAVVFPAIDPSTRVLDYGEGNDGGNWYIYNIQLKPKKSPIPNFAFGNWYNQKTGDYYLSVLGSAAIFQQKIWHWAHMDLTDQKGVITLKSGSEQVELAFSQGKDGTLLVTAPDGSVISCTHEPDIQVYISAHGNEGFEPPLFKNDTAIYCGHVSGYSPRIGMKTFTVYVDNVLTGRQDSYLGELDENGNFAVKIPLAYAESVFVEPGFSGRTIFLQPGEKLFQLVENGASYFMGKSAEINRELTQLKFRPTYNYRYVRDHILGMTPEEYKAYCMDLWKTDAQKVDDWLKDRTILQKTGQILKADVDYCYAENLMSYKMDYISAYRRKNKIPRTQRNVDVAVDSLKPSYFDFVTDKFANNPLALLSTEYYSFINHLKYMDLVSGTQGLSMTTFELVDYMKEKGYRFSDSEQKIVDSMSKTDSLSNLPKVKKFNDTYHDAVQAFFKKYQDDYQNLRKMKHPSAVSINDLGDYLKEQGDSLTKDEQELLVAFKKYRSLPEVKELNEFYRINSDSMSAFHARHQNYLDDYFVQARKKNRMQRLATLLNIQAGLATDIMNAQDVCRTIVSQITPAEDWQLQAFQGETTTPFIASYVALRNEQTKAKIAENRSRSGYSVNEVPTTTADKIFDAIMKKYRGKVVYVDFWATWCGPCRSGIQRIKPLKEEMDSSKVAFVYITNQTSPKSTWDNMIPNIKGEHYRVSRDEWNYLSSKFNISGIPHYVLVGKDGSVINPELGHLSNASIKQLLEKYSQN